MSDSSLDKPKSPTVSPALVVRFRLVHVLYAMALLASALATFGARGFVPAVIILIVWAFVFASRSRPRALADACVMLLPFCCFGLMVPTIVHRHVSHRAECMNNLKQIAIALHNYHDTYGSFPPACVRDKNGEPMHSWRVLILPFVEQQSLYDAYDFDEPWDGPNNRKLASQVPYVYSCATHSSTSQRKTPCASYFAVVDAKTAWPRTTARHLKYIQEADGISQTILIIEADLPDVPWTEPRDLSYEEAMRLLTPSEPSRTRAHRSEDFFYVHYVGCNVALADGSVRFLYHGLPRDTAAALLTYDGGERIKEDFGRYSEPPKKRLKLGNCYRLAVFAVVALFPLPWVWISPKRKTAAHAAEFKN